MQHFFSLFCIFLILDNLFNTNNNLSFLQKSDSSDSNREKKVPFITLSFIKQLYDERGEYANKVQ